MLADNNPAEGITVYSVGEGLGDLQLIQTVKSDNPAYVVVHPSQKYLYALNEIQDYQGDKRASLEAYTIDENTGELSRLNRISCSHIPAQIVVSPNGEYLVVGTYMGATYELFPIAADGRLSKATFVLPQKGKGPHSRQEASHPHAVAFDPSGNFLATADLGTDEVKIFKLHKSQLLEISRVKLASGSGPRHVAFNPTGTILYVINELSATITSFAYESKSGKLGAQLQTVSTVPQAFPGHKSTAEIMVHPNGKTLYCTNRKFADHPLADSIVTYRIEEDGRLRLMNFVTEDIQFARTFNIDPSASWLYVMNQKGDSILQFSIDANSGALTRTGNSTAVMVPVSMAFKS